MNYFLIEVFGGNEPVLHGPFMTAEEQEVEAKKLLKNNDPDSDAVFWLDTDGEEAEVGTFPASIEEGADA